MDGRRFVPRTDTVLADPRLVAAAARLGRARVKAAVVAAQQQARTGQISPDDVPAVALATLPQAATSLLPVINATGVVLHTNLGRAPLSEAAVAAMSAAAGYTDLEFDLASGSRGSRGAGLRRALAAAVPAARAVHVVNNNAAALVLAATALAAGREIVVSRGEMIEIGDGFRLPDLLACTGARLHEVGTTNRTTVADYAAAITPETGFVLKVHPSNFRIEGFTAEASIAELASLSVPLVADIGSGLLARHPQLPDEPDASTWLEAGAALVTASGDKLLGGPQAGLILGRADLVTQLARHPLARALRVDKMTIAALEASLTGPPVPLAVMLAAGERALASRARRIAGQLAGAGIDARAVPCTAAVGGGGAPGVGLPSAAVSLPAALAAVLRDGEAVRSGSSPAVVGRIEEGRLLLDLKAVQPAEDPGLTAAVLAAGAVLTAAAPAPPAELPAAPALPAAPPAAPPAEPPAAPAATPEPSAAPASLQPAPAAPAQPEPAQPEPALAPLPPPHHAKPPAHARPAHARPVPASPVPARPVPPRPVPPRPVPASPVPPRPVPASPVPASPVPASTDEDLTTEVAAPEEERHGSDGSTFFDPFTPWRGDSVPSAGSPHGS